ncbi:hypothetical protein [Marinomonas pollencensis]|uniref:Uncharacterized protein n=1 Tax=Marinomonas pollencensis TaxID=491954 RepID=A0A3E0DKW0_9GAMM|nr:hypothetical protein [Marinomonas pollencensis]REG82156.1 hypothetical protein DFP81_11043 [Marinomonas pollencensis]
MNLLFWSGIAFTLIAPVVIGIQFDDQSTSWVAALCGAFVTFMARIGDLAELSLGPVKARMKEQIEKAAATIDQLRQVATTTSEATLTDLMAGSFMGGMSLKKRLELHDNIIDALKGIGASEAQLELAEKDWKKGISIIYQRAIRNAVEERPDPNKINVNASDEQKKADKEINDLMNFERWECPSPSQIRSVLKKYQIESPSAEKWISDYEFFLETNVIRNRAGFEQV